VVRDKGEGVGGVCFSGLGGHASGARRRRTAAESVKASCQGLPAL
jgi:hypothetical protein